MPQFIDRLTSAVQKRGNPVVVGLDPRVESMPAALRPADAADVPSVASAFEEFCREIIDVVAPLVPAVKPQMAFFEQLGPPGMQALADVVRHARMQHLLVILDGKRNDIGSTAAAYASAYLGPHQSVWQADALTVSPYLGDDSLAPFVQAATENSAGIFVLVKTSNPGSRTLQDLSVAGEPLYCRVADLVEGLAVETLGTGGYGDVGAVVGATFPDQLSELRQRMPHTWFLVPGFGAQGATAADVCGAFDSRGLGAVVNSSRGIIFAYERPQYAQHASWQSSVDAATRDMIQQLRQSVTIHGGGDGGP